MKFLSSLNRKDLQNKTCLLRVDFNIKDSELDKNNLRIRAVLPTIKFLIDNGAKVVILSHRGRPDKKCQISNIERQKLTLKPFAEILSSLLKKPVHFIDFKKEKKFDAAQISKTITRDSIFLLENLRFFDGEEKNDKNFAKQLASFGDFYVNDAFSVSHRKNASVVAITEFLSSYAGLLLEKEIKNFSSVMNPFDKTQDSRRVYRGVKNPKKPLVIILGGAKISDKIGVIKNFFKIADYFLIGGGMANTFLAAQGLPVGDSLFEKKAMPVARKFLKFKSIILPVDTAVYKKQILDIGPETIEKYSKIIKNARTIIWNGPMGYIEDKKFRKGSEAIAKAIINNKKAFSIIGGGETTSIVSGIKCQVSGNIFISTGGGAMLEYLAGKKLPGIEALNNITNCKNKR